MALMLAEESPNVLEEADARLSHACRVLLCTVNFDGRINANAEERHDHAECQRQQGIAHQPKDDGADGCDSCEPDQSKLAPKTLKRIRGSIFPWDSATVALVCKQRKTFTWKGEPNESAAMGPPGGSHLPDR